MKEFTVKINKEITDYMERLSYDIETRKSIITRLFDDAKTAVDDSILSSPAFKTYHKELEEAVASYEVAKSDLSKELDCIVEKHEGHKVSAYNWSINDFRQPEVQITITEE